MRSAASVTSSARQLSSKPNWPNRNGEMPSNSNVRQNRSGKTHWWQSTRPWRLRKWHSTNVPLPSSNVQRLSTPSALRTP